jgi:hypothetical protein
MKGLVLCWPFICCFPPNVGMFAILYFTLYRYLNNDDDKNMKKFRWPIVLCVYYIISLCFWITVCMIISNVPPVGPLKILEVISDFC